MNNLQNNKNLVKENNEMKARNSKERMTPEQSLELACIIRDIFDIGRDIIHVVCDFFKKDKQQEQVEEPKEEKLNSSKSIIKVYLKNGDVVEKTHMIIEDHNDEKVKNHLLKEYGDLYDKYE